MNEESSPSISGSTGNEPVNCTACELDEFLCNLAEGYLPCVSSELCTSSPALAEGYLPTFYSDTSQSAQSKSMSIASKSFRRGKKTVVFHGFPSLKMSRHSTEDLGAALLTWFLADSRVRTYPLPGLEPELTVIGQDCGVKWHESSVRFDPVSCSWKTAHCLWEEDLPWCSVTLPKWGSMRNGHVFQHPTLVRPINVIASGLWPTPTASNGLDGGSNSRAASLKAGQTVPGAGQLNPTWVEKLMGWPDDWTSLQPTSHVKMCFWLMGMHNGTETGRSEVMRMLRSGDAAQEIQREIGRPIGIHEAAILLAELCEHAHRPDEARLFMACAEALEEEMRGVRLCEGTTGAPHRPGQSEQRSGEHTDAMQALSRLLAHHGQAAWKDGSWEDAVPRVATGVANRMDRLKAIGNGQVPLCAATAWRLLANI